MSDKDKTSSQGQIPEAQFIAAIQAQQDRISMLEGELTKLIQTQRASVNDKIQGLKPPKPDTFDGRQVDTFLYSLDKVFGFYRIEDERKVQLAVTYFRGAALRWYKYIEHQYKGKSELINWNQFTTLMKKHFEASNTETAVRNKLNALRQMASVSKYNDMFNTLIIELLGIDERTKIDMYCRGLKQNIQLHVSLRTPQTLEEAQATALNVDNIFSANGMAYHRNGPGSNNWNSSKNRDFRPSGMSSTPMELGNTEEDSSEAMVNSIQRPSFKKLSDSERDQLRKENKCFKCRKVGHMARKCFSDKKN
jgi:hypothetical protein